MHLFESKERISMKISLTFVPKGPTNNISALVQIMDWRRPGDKPLSEPMLTQSNDAYMRHKGKMNRDLIRPQRSMVTCICRRRGSLWFLIKKIIASSCSCHCPMHRRQMLSREWRCSWSSTDRRYSNHTWVISKFITYQAAPYIRYFTIFTMYLTRQTSHDSYPGE